MSLGVPTSSRALKASSINKEPIYIGSFDINNINDVPFQDSIKAAWARELGANPQLATIQLPASRPQVDSRGKKSMQVIFADSNNNKTVVPVTL